MVMKWTTLCLVALLLCSSLCNARVTGGGPGPYQKPATDKFFPQGKQLFEERLNWQYPEPPATDATPDIVFELKHPVSAATVSVECKEDIVHVDVKKDMFGTGQYIDPSVLTLGPCSVTGEHSGIDTLFFESDLHGCGSSLTTTEHWLTYTFTLYYTPQGTVVRTSQTAVTVECHYPRKHNVSSLPLDPLWVPFSAIKVSEEFLYFTLKIMTDDWQFERPSNQYFLGDMINFEATVKQYFHVPLRVYVDYCVATLSSDPNSTPKYAFIDNYGCFVDGRVTGSRSKFMARTVDNKLQYQLEAFRFQGVESGVLYITCHLKATSASSAITHTQRACSYTNEWREASGDLSVCNSCHVATDQSIMPPTRGGGSQSQSGPGTGYSGTNSGSGTGHSGTNSGPGTGYSGTNSGPGTGYSGTNSGSGTGYSGTNSGSGTGHSGTNSGSGTGHSGTNSGSDTGFSGSRFTTYYSKKLHGGSTPISGSGNSGTTSGFLKKWPQQRARRDVSEKEIVEWEGDITMRISVGEKNVA